MDKTNCVLTDAEMVALIKESTRPRSLSIAMGRRLEDVPGNDWAFEWLDETRNLKVCDPCSVPTDPQQRLDITCAYCGIPIDFRKGEVFKNGSSYVCQKHSEQKKRNPVEEDVKVRGKVI